LGCLGRISFGESPLSSFFVVTTLQKEATCLAAVFEHAFVNNTVPLLALLNGTAYGEDGSLPDDDDFELLRPLGPPVSCWWYPIILWFREFDCYGYVTISVGSCWPWAFTS
jgi:hypothetical protein